MARRLDSFPEQQQAPHHKYPWTDWGDGSVWEIRRGVDYDVPTESMRVNLHMRAEALSQKVRTRKVKDGNGEGLVFQFLESDDTEAVKMLAAQDPDGTQDAKEQLYRDAVELYERARTEVIIERRDGTRQRYVPVRFKQRIDKAHEEDTLVPAVARIIRRPTLGFDHLARAKRPDLMLETLVLDPSKPYHRLFTPKTIQLARERLAAYEGGQASQAEVSA